MTPRTLATLAALIVALPLLAACGVDGAPRPPGSEDAVALPPVPPLPEDDI